jgi:flavin-dependent dehydrogenase
MQHFDALIIGGGPAGSTVAILLAQAGWSVALVEQKQFPRRKVCGEYLSATNWPLLARLGVAEEFAQQAGPTICETAIFAGQRQYRAALPQPRGGESWGRALAREHLDTLLIHRAMQCGATVFQPAKCVDLRRTEQGHVARLEGAAGAHSCELAAAVTIASHGSWEIGTLITQRKPRGPNGRGWLAFKAHFQHTNLPADLMPLLCFVGGYGGMVHVGGGRVSLSCCIQRRIFDRLLRSADVPAGETVLTHLLQSCPVLRPVLDVATRDGNWLSAGVIQPGIRPRYRDGVFVLGNAAGEAHPVVAEGISMAMQSAWLLAERLIPHRGDWRRSIHDQVGRDYSAAWQRAFARRIFAASAIAHWASRPRLVHATGPLLSLLPAIITWGARAAGKSQIILPGLTQKPATECYQG